MAAGKEGLSIVSHECQSKCSSRQHASNLTAVLAKHSLSDEKVAAYIKWCCVRYSKALDSTGRNLVHVAASVGRLKLLNFLLKHKDVNINEKDAESHYTALHRSIFYGQIHCAVRLVEQGASIQQLDLDDLTPLDHFMKDRPSILQYNISHPCEVYVWGTNRNYTLGIGRHQSRTNPEPLDMFRRQRISIKQVIMSKFHSAFISTDGRIWVCGHGQGGRLGLQDELTQLTPKEVNVPINCEVTMIDLGRDHTVVLMANNTVWSFGLNTYHQLGHTPPPEKLLSPKPIKWLQQFNIIGIRASKYHSVFWTKDKVYTCGLNAGQLGHAKEEETTITKPKAVVYRCFDDIKHVASSDGAIVLSNVMGEVFLLYKYRCKRIVSKSRSIIPKKICVIGGHLDHRTNVECLQEKGGDELKIIIIDNCDSIYLWEEKTGAASRCELSLRRRIHITDAALNKNSLLIVSEDGEAFKGEFKTKKKKLRPDSETDFRKIPDESSPRDKYDYIKLTKIPHVHRGVQITSDLKGLNFAVTQVFPKAGLFLLPEAVSTDMKKNMEDLYGATEQFDPLLDVTFEVEGQLMSAHRYIVAYSSPALEEMMKKAVPANGKCHVKIDNIPAHVFRRILCYIYTRDCDLFHTNVRPIRFDAEVDQTEIIPRITPDLSNIDYEMISAFEYNMMKSPGQKKAIKGKEKDNPLKILKSAAKKFEIRDLQTKLEELRYESGYIFKTEEKRSMPDRLKFDRNKLDYLWDVSLKSEDNKIIKAHKCILVSRLEYFDCMLNQSWLESTQKSAIYLPIPGKVLQILINYLYTDEAPDVLYSEDPDLITMTLVIADQFFCSGLKEYAEVALANLISLKNAAYILHISFTYNAPQLKRCCMEFICLNLPAIIESRSLETVHDSVLIELTKFYRNWLPCMSTRTITAYENFPEDSFVDLIAKTEPVSLDTVEEDTPSKLASKSTKKKPREKRNSESDRKRNISTGSLTSEDEPEPLPVLDFCEETDGKEEDIWVKVVNHPSKQKNAKVRVPLEAAKLVSQPQQEENPVNLNKIFPKEEKENINRLQKEFQALSTSSEKEFPALNASSTERTYTAHPRSPRQSLEVFKKFVKLSQKQRKRLNAQSISEDEDTVKKPEVSVKSPWALPKNESILLDDIMKEESKANSAGQNIASSPPWLGTAKPGSSLSTVMASERKHRELLARMMSKPLEYTQMEDKAMEDLLLLYNAHDVTDERITVRRAEYKFVSAPIWVSNRK